MSTTTKQQFYARPTISSLSAKEKNARWKQHQAGKRSARPGTGQRKRGTKLKRQGNIVQLQMSGCAQDYFLAMQAPFALKRPACVPDMHAVPSKKIRVKTRGTFSTGTVGTGFCVAAAWANSSDNAGLYHSTATYSNPKGVPLQTDPGVSFAVQSKLPYGSASFMSITGNNLPPAVEARTVAVAMRIRNTGPRMAYSGQIVGFRQPSNVTVENTEYDDNLSYSTSKTFRNKGQWIYAQWRPVEPTEYEFSKYPNRTMQNADVPAHNWEFGFEIAGTTSVTGDPGPSPFEWEMIRYVEYIGNIDNVSRSHVDLTGVSHVRNSLPTKSSTDKPHHTLLTGVKSLEDSIGESLPAGAAGAYAYSKYGAGAAQAEEGGGLMEAISAASDYVMAGISDLVPEGMGALAELAPMMML